MSMEGVTAFRVGERRGTWTKGRGHRGCPINVYFIERIKVYLVSRLKQKYPKCSFIRYYLLRRNIILQGFLIQYLYSVPTMPECYSASARTACHK